MGRYADHTDETLCSPPPKLLSGDSTLRRGRKITPSAYAGERLEASRVQRGTRTERGRGRLRNLGLLRFERAPDAIILEATDLSVRHGPNLSGVIHDDDPHEIILLGVVDDRDRLATRPLFRDE